MKAYKAEDLRTFTQALFTRDCFDPFLVVEAEFRTYCLFSVRGNTERGWYTDEELETEQVEDYTSWKKLRPVCFSLIRGRKTPVSFRITFRLPPAEEEELLHAFAKEHPVVEITYRVDNGSLLYLAQRVKELQLNKRR